MVLSRFLLQLKCNLVGVQCIRSHYKFNATQRLQQKNIINKLLRNNENFKNIIEDKPIIVSKGSPSSLAIHAKGGDSRGSRVMTRRMKMLNKQFLQCITDVLLTEDIGNYFKELDVRITQVRVGQSFDTLNVYWVSKCESTERVAQMLNQLKGRLHQHIVDRNFMTAVPWIQFVLDIDQNHCQEVENILQKCDFGPDFEPSDKTLFETPYERINRLDERPNSRISKIFENSEKVYELISFQKPNDMKLNTLGLDYELIINIVLSNLKKSRAQHRSFNAVADPLPPTDWSLPTTLANDENNAVYNTDQRIKAMKRFLVENRKKRQKLSREARKRQILEQMAISEEMTDAKQRYYDNLIEIDVDTTPDFIEDEL